MDKKRMARKLTGGMEAEMCAKASGPLFLLRQGVFLRLGGGKVGRIVLL